MSNVSQFFSGGGSAPVNSLAPIARAVGPQYTAPDGTVWLATGYVDSDYASYPDAKVNAYITTLSGTSQQYPTTGSWASTSVLSAIIYLSNGTLAYFSRTTDLWYLHSSGTLNTASSSNSFGNTSNDDPNSVFEANGFVWAWDFLDRVLYPHDLNFAASGTQKTLSNPAPVSNNVYVTYADPYIYAYDANTNIVSQHAFADGVGTGVTWNIASINPTAPFVYPIAIGHYNNQFFLCEPNAADGHKIYRFNSSFELIETLEIGPGPNTSSGSITSMHIDGTGIARILFGTPRIYYVDVSGTSMRMLSLDTNTIESYVTFPDGTVYTMRDNVSTTTPVIWEYSPQGTPTLRTGFFTTGVAVSSGSKILNVNGDLGITAGSSLYVFNRTTGALIRTVAVNALGVFANRDGTRLFASASNSSVQIREINPITGADVGTYTASGGTFSGITSVSISGSYLDYLMIYVNQTTDSCIFLDTVSFKVVASFASNAFPSPTGGDFNYQLLAFNSLSSTIGLNSTVISAVGVGYSPAVFAEGEVPYFVRIA